MKPVVRRLVQTVVAGLVFTLAGCGANDTPNDSPAPAADPASPPLKATKDPSQVSPK
jgi:hypothetical protein